MGQEVLRRADRAVGTAVKKRTILLLEDDPAQVLAFQALADGLHDMVVSTNNVADALRILRQSTVDACVVDLGVYTRSRQYASQAGIGFIAAARRRGYSTMPIIVASVTRDPAVLVPCFEAGADDYVLKLSGVDDLVARVKRWLGQMPLAAEALRDRRARVLETLRRPEVPPWTDEAGHRP